MRPQDREAGPLDGQEAGLRQEVINREPLSTGPATMIGRPPQCSRVSFIDTGHSLLSLFTEYFMILFCFSSFHFHCIT